MDGADQGQHLAVGQTLAIRRASTLLGTVAVDADVKHVTHFGQGKSLALRSNPGVPHRTSLAKCAVAFFRISFSRLSRRFSARSLESSISSGVTTLPPVPPSFPSADALTQLRKVWSPG